MLFPTNLAKRPVLHHSAADVLFATLALMFMLGTLPRGLAPLATIAMLATTQWLTITGMAVIIERDGRTHLLQTRPGRIFVLLSTLLKALTLGILLSLAVSYLAPAFTGPIGVTLYAMLFLLALAVLWLNGYMWMRTPIVVLPIFFYTGYCAIAIVGPLAPLLLPIAFAGIEISGVLLALSALYVSSLVALEAWLVRHPDTFDMKNVSEEIMKNTGA